MLGGEVLLDKNIMYCILLLALLPFCFTNDESASWESVDDGLLFEGDMVMSKENIEQTLNGKSRNTFGLQKSNYYRWKNAIVPYKIDDSFSGNALRIKTLKKAMKAWEEKTCIKFVERTNENDYLNIFSAGFGKCYSNVGRIGGKQKLSLGWGCFGKGVAIHELGHALGLHHEQSRPDRDSHVYINWNNIIEEHKHNFRKYEHRIDSLGSPYDYDSIMHYEWNAFAKFPLLRTIGAKNGQSIGQRSHISVQDAWQINKYYECDKQ